MSWMERTPETLRTYFTDDAMAETVVWDDFFPLNLFHGLCRDAWNAQLSPDEVFAASARITLALEKEFYPELPPSTPLTAHDISMYYDFNRKAGTDLGIDTTKDAFLRSLAIQDQLYLQLPTLLLHITQNPEPLTDTWDDIPYVHNDGTRGTLTVPSLAKTIGIISEYDHVGISIDPLPYHVVLSEMLSSSGSDYIPTKLTPTVRKVFQVAESMHHTSGWASEFMRLQGMYLSQESAFWATLPPGDTPKGLIIAGLYHDALPEAHESVFAHEAGHLAWFRRERALGVKLSSRTMHEIMAERASKEYLQQTNQTDTVEYMGVNDQFQHYINSLTLESFDSYAVTREGQAAAYMVHQLRIDVPTWRRILTAIVSSQE